MKWLLRRKKNLQSKISCLIFVLVIVVLINIHLGFIQFNSQRTLPWERSRLNYSNGQANNHNEKTNTVCPRLSLYTHQLENITYGTCRPHRPTKQACELAEKLYSLDPGLGKCKVTRPVGEVCIIQIRESPDLFGVVCNTKLCYESGGSDGTGNFKIYTLDPKNGELKLKQRFSTVRNLEEGLADIIRETIMNKFYFLFIKCETINSWHAESSEISQLLPIPPQLTVQHVNNTRSKNSLNVNILLLDSASRAHFYRSLPRTISTFKQWVKNSSNLSASVFDFELFQAVHGHTKEVTHALFTGRLVPPNSGSNSVGMEELFGHYKRAGYQTMWQEDLCFKAVWGLMMDIGAGNSWETLQKNLPNAFIDHTGITHSSCEVLGAYGVTTPFSGPDGDQICYNGRFQHSYFLRSVVDTVKAISQLSLARPLLSYMSLSVPHDHRGRRIQTLDNNLVQYITDIACDDNTLTIILADHGNTYTEYTNSIMEGRFEMFHPHLFLIVPKNAASLLGAEAMAALRVNQRRLVSAFDLHHSLMAIARPLAGDVKPVGLFAPVPMNRTCDDIELRTPNLCVCEGWDSPTENDPMKLGLVEFAIGELNNLIQDQYMNSMEKMKATKPTLQACQRLKPLSFKNCRERNLKSRGSLISSFDVNVQAGDVVDHKQDVFHIEVESFELPGETSLKMKLLNFERLSMFAKYSQCVDKGVDLKLCICSENATEGGTVTTIVVGNAKEHSQNTKTGPTIYFPWHTYLNYFNQAPGFMPIDNNCLFLSRRMHDKGMAFAYEVISTCTSQVTVRVDITKMNNIRLSHRVPFNVEIWPQSVRFVISARRYVPYWDHSLDVSAKYIR